MENHESKQIKTQSRLIGVAPVTHVVFSEGLQQPAMTIVIITIIPITNNIVNPLGQYRCSLQHM